MTGAILVLFIFFVPNRTSGEETSIYPLDLPWSSRTSEYEPSKQTGENSRKSKSSNSELLDSDDDDDDDDDKEGEILEEKEEEILGKGNVIHFHHTETKVLSSNFFSMLFEQTGLGLCKQCRTLRSRQAKPLGLWLNTFIHQPCLSRETDKVGI